MADELIISGGGSVAVATEGMLAAIERCEQAANIAAMAAGELVGTAEELRGWASLDPSGHALRLAADRTVVAASLATSATAPAGMLGTALGLAAEGYGIAETIATRAAESAIESAAALFGRLLPGLFVLATPAIAIGAATAAAAGELVPKLAERLGLRDELVAIGTATADGLNQLLSDPRVVTLIRNGVMAADDLLVGAMGLPPALTAALGEDGLRLTGVPFAAAALTTAAGTVGLLRETDVKLADTQVVAADVAADAPDGWAERFDRIPEAGSGTDGMQVVIERYEMPDGTANYEVYVAGTVTFDPVAADEPWDMTSNIENAQGADAAAVRAVAEAMEAAGIDATTPVQLTGYSQGAAVVARVATLGAFDVAGVVAFGGNTGQIPIPEGIPTVIVEHCDDIVPALGGRQDNEKALIVERQAYGPGNPPPESVAIPAHRRPAYAQTADLMDSSDSDQIAAQTKTFAVFTEGAESMTVTEFRFERAETEEG